nr:hypothetical protein [Nitrosospira sp. Nsp18]
MFFVISGYLMRQIFYRELLRATRAPNPPAPVPGDAGNSSVCLVMDEAAPPQQSFLAKRAAASLFAPNIQYHLLKHNSLQGQRQAC